MFIIIFVPVVQKIKMNIIDTEVIRILWKKK